MKLVLTLLVVAVITSGCEGTVIFISTGPSTVVVNAGHVDGGTTGVGRPVAGRRRSNSPTEQAARTGSDNAPDQTKGVLNAGF